MISTTLHDLNKPEGYLEDFIADNLDVLELEAGKTGIHGPFVIFKQNDLINALEKTVIPDLILFSASGHVVVIEVKLSSNPELKDRKVIAQAIDYAGAFYNKSDIDLLEIFSKKDSMESTWGELIKNLFPEEQYIENITAQIERRLSSGEIDLIVACDKAPVGLSGLLRGASKQSALPFSLKLIEVTPYINNKEQKEPSLFLSKVLLKTEIVSRTVVNVYYSEVEPGKPSVNVETTPIEEIEQHIFQEDESKIWTKEEIEEAFLSSDNEVLRHLMQFAKEHSYNNQIHSSGKKLKPAFGFYIKGKDKDNLERIRQVFNYCSGSPRLTIYINNIEFMSNEETFDSFITKLKKLFPNVDLHNKREPNVLLEDVYKNFEEFKNILTWLKNNTD